MNVYEMLQPGGQFFICTFCESPIDSVFEQLDNGRWSKYENFRAISAFYKSESVVEKFRNIIDEVGFKNGYVQDLPNQLPRFTEDALNGRTFSFTNIFKLY